MDAHENQDGEAHGQGDGSPAAEPEREALAHPVIYVEAPHAPHQEEKSGEGKPEEYVVYDNAADTQPPRAVAPRGGIAVLKAMKKPPGEQPADRNRGNRGPKARLENAHTTQLSSETPETDRGDNRIPFLATSAAGPYQAIGSLPVSVLLENVRSLYNVGAFFRTADGTGIERLYLAGITGSPPDRMISKTALGAEETVAWERAVQPEKTLSALRESGHEIVAIETSVHAVDLFDWQPRFPVCVVFGHETEGLSPAVAAFADTHVRIPMLGMKHSLNVATAAGVVLYELLRKYRLLCQVRK